jgi:hypothetical protein
VVPVASLLSLTFVPLSIVLSVQVLYLVLVDAHVSNLRFCVGRDPIAAGVYQLFGINVAWFASSMLRLAIFSCRRRARSSCGSFFRVPFFALYCCARSTAAASRVPWFKWYVPLASDVTYTQHVDVSTDGGVSAVSESFGGDRPRISPAVAGTKADLRRPGHPFLGADGRAVWGSPPIGLPLLRWAYALAKLWVAERLQTPLIESGERPSVAQPLSSVPVKSGDIAAQLVRMRVAAGRAVQTRAAVAQVIT